MRGLWWCCVFVAVVGCTDEPSNSPLPDSEDTGAVDAGRDASPDADVAEVADVDSPEVVPLREQTLGEPTLWARPIEDYLAAGREQAGPGVPFLTQIHDLRVFEDRLYLGYGDANINLGRVTPIEMRSFETERLATVSREFVTEEEQIDRYRVLDGALFVAGVDATEDAWLGNVYFKPPGGAWVKSRTLEGGVHVHDVAFFEGAIYAVGSGATPEEWMAGDIYSHLWRSLDGGQSFEVVAREHNGGRGDARWTRLLVFDGALWAFGYKTDAQGTIDMLNQARFDGEDLAPLPDGHALSLALVTETDTLPGGVGLVRGIDVSVDPVANGAWAARPGMGVTAIEALSGKTVVDASHHAATGESLLLVRDGSAPQGPVPGSSAAFCVLVTVDLTSFEEVLCVETHDPLVSLAWWRGHLFLGTHNGKLLRSSPL